MRRVSPESYEYKFGRKPKVRTIKEVHDIYIKAKDRSDIKSKVISDIIDEIVEKIPTTGRYNKHITYFYHTDGTLYQYEMSYMSEWGTIGTSYNRVVFEGTVEQKRDAKLELLLSNDLAFELGEKYNKFERYNKHLHHYVKHELIEMITDKLKEKYKDVKFINMPKVMPVIIDGYKYIFGLDSQSSGYYKKFELIGELNMEFIEL